MLKNQIDPGAKKSTAVFDTRFKWSFLHPRFWTTWLFITLSFVIYLLPARLVDIAGSKLGDTLRKTNKKRFNIAYKNISLCYADYSENKKQQFLKKHFRAYGRSILHYGFILWGSEKTAEQRIELHGQHYIDNAIDEGSSAIVMTAHCVGLETAVSTISRNYNLTGPFKDMKNPVINWFVAKRRTRYGAVLYSREAGLRPIIKDVKAGYVMGYLPDEDLGREQSIFVPFMGVDKATIPVLGRLTKTCKAKVFPCICCYDEKQAKYHVHVLPALENFPQRDDRLDTLTMNQSLESLIDICPEQYFWTLRFFKTRPEGEVRFY